MTTTPFRPLLNSVWRYIGPELGAYGELQVVAINQTDDVVAIGENWIWHGVASEFFLQFQYVGPLCKLNTL